MTLLRLSILMLLIMALIPTSQGNRYSLVTIFTSLVQDVSEFCERKPEACRHMRNVFASLGDKAVYLANVFSGGLNTEEYRTSAVDQDNRNTPRHITNYRDDSVYAGRERGQGYSTYPRSEQEFLQQNRDRRGNFTVPEVNREPLKFSQRAAPSGSQNTLTEDDLATEWQSPDTDAGA